MRNFRNLDIWLAGKELVKKVYHITSLFPGREIYSISDQIRRSSVSIPSNIAEGCSRSSKKELVRFLEIAIGSSFELETHLEISNDLGYIKPESFDEILEEIHILQSRINAFRTFLLYKTS